MGSRVLRGLTAPAVSMVVAAASVTAQEVVDVAGPDRRIEGEFDLVFQVGAPEGEPWETFGEVRGVGFDASGRLHVFDPLEARVVVFEADGTYAHTVGGRRGEGPGELRAPISFVVLPDGEVVIQDAGHQAYLVFGADGRHRGSVPFASSGAVQAVRISSGALIPDLRGGAFYDGGTTISGPGPGGGGGGRDVHRVSLAEDDDRRVVFTAWRPDAVGGPQADSRSDGVTAVRFGAGPRIWEPGVHLAPLPDGGVAVVDSTTWTVRLMDPDGRWRGSVRRPELEPVPVTPRLEARERERRLERMEEDGGVPRITLGNGATLPPEQLRALARSRIESATFYPEIPVIQGLRASPAGVLWVGRTSLPGEGPAAIDLVGWDGRYLGTLVDDRGLPDALGPDGLAAWVERDALDVPRIVVRRVRAG